MITGLTDRQAEILAFIDSRTPPPSVREMCAHFGITTNAVNCHLLALEKKGYIRREHRKARGITLLRLPTETVVRRAVEMLRRLPAARREIALSQIRVEAMR